MLPFIRYLAAAIFVALGLLVSYSTAQGQCLMSDSAHHHQAPATAPEDLISMEDVLHLQSNQRGGYWYVPVSIHFILDEYGKGNFRPNDDGNGDATYTGYDHAEALIHEANRLLARNDTMALFDTSQGTPPAYPILIRLTLDGVYFHRNSQLAQTSSVHGFNLGVANSTYGKNINSTINLYFSKNMATDASGFPILQGKANWIGLRPLSSLIQNDWRVYTAHKSSSAPIPVHYMLLTARLLLHELGHNWDLWHAWESNDRCNDTPPHAASYFQCNTNNLMDYSCHWPALTPCQLQRIYTRLIGGDLSSYVQNFGCPPTHAFFDLPDTVSLSQIPLSVPFTGQASWGESRYKLEIFSVTGPGSTIPANPADYFITTRTGVVKNLNLASLYTFSPNKTYMVKLSTYYDTDTLNCTTSDQYAQYLHTIGLTPSNPTDPPQNDNRYHFQRMKRTASAGPSTAEEAIDIQMAIMPNPAQDWINIEYNIQGGLSKSFSEGQCTLSLIDARGSVHWRQAYASLQDLPTRLDLSSFPPGVYHLVLTQGHPLVNQRLIILHP